MLHDERRIRVDAFPISIDFEATQRVAAQPRTRRRAAEIRAGLGGPRRMLLGVDRLDYTKGIEQRLEAYGRLLADGDLRADDTVFVQVATPSRQRLAQYASLRDRVERLTGRLNGAYSGVGHNVVHYTSRQYSFDELVALFAAADVMVTTPLSDGMNLVAKEYVGSRVDNRGALVLSEFAGASAELDQALLVNPNDAEELRGAMLLAAGMRPDEQRRRMEIMRGHLQRHDVRAWVRSFLDALRMSA
ncbi:alpha,alpha-trehalose-phosphate synthase (UDP-forming) [Dactylosporangium darangshiense]|uniref:alpha,alpha-trehalose-phosphate synthase (UDP-forming) n=1 Tax=Dactylosporangium darangshiense TaxID=579108 RepID=UPI0031E781BA